MVTPVELPSLTFLNTVNFELERYELTGDGGGLGQIAEYQDPRWRMSYDFSGFPNLKAFDGVKNWLRGLRGMRTPVLCFDPRRRVPLHYYDDADKPLASGSPWGSPSIADYSRSASTFDLEDWTPNIQLYAGDYFSFQDTSDIWHLHTLEEDAQVDGSGDVTVKVQDRPARGLTHGNATLRVRDACCQAVITYDPRALVYGGDKGAGITLEGYEMKRSFI